MKRLLAALSVFCALGLLGTGITLALLMRGKTFRAIDIAVLSAVAAPFLAWRIYQIGKQSFEWMFHRGIHHMAAGTQSTIGYAVQEIASLTEGDLSLLVMALGHKGDGHVIVVTSKGSPNDRAWSALKRLGLMGEIAPEAEVDEKLVVSPKRFYLTDKGKAVVPTLLRTASTLRAAAPELV